MVGAGVWQHVAGPTGRWDDRWVGRVIGPVVMEDPHGARTEMNHPAIILVHSEDCRYCRPAASAFWAAAPEECSTIRYFLITADSIAPQTPQQNPGCGGAFRVPTPAPALGFIDQVPTTMATNAAGELKAVFVGIPDSDVFGALLRAALDGAATGGSVPYQSSGGSP